MKLCISQGNEEFYVPKGSGLSSRVLKGRQGKRTGSFWGGGHEHSHWDSSELKRQKENEAEYLGIAYPWGENAVKRFIGRKEM